MEPSWFWDWYPSEYAQKKLSADIQKINTFEDGAGAQVRLKALVPMQLKRKHGEIESVGAVPVMRLPALFRECEWTFEIN